MNDLYYLYYHYKFTIFTKFTMSTDDTYASGQEIESFSSTPPRPLPPAKRMRLSITRVDLTLKGKRSRPLVLPPLSKRFRFDDATSSTSSASPRPRLRIEESPSRMSPDLLAPRKISGSESSTCIEALQNWRAHSPVESPSFSHPAVPLPASPVSLSAVPLPSTSPSPCASGIYSLYSLSPSRTPSPSEGSTREVGNGTTSSSDWSSDTIFLSQVPLPSSSLPVAPTYGPLPSSSPSVTPTYGPIPDTDSDGL